MPKTIDNEHTPDALIQQAVKVTKENGRLYNKYDCENPYCYKRQISEDKEK